MKLVSVCIPIIKTEFLEKSISSCLAQSFTDFELIILNNAKEAEVKNQIRAIARTFNDDRIRYFENDAQLPMIENWNRCVELAEGKYFSILCDDDIWQPDFLKEIILLTEKYPSVHVFRSRVAVVDENDNIIKVSEKAPEFSSVLDFIYARISDFNTFFLSDFVLKTEELKQMGGFVQMPSGWGSDDLTYYKLGAKNGIVCSSELNFYYRDSPLSVTNNNKLKQKLKAIDIQVRTIKDILENSKSVTNNIENSALQKMILKKLPRFKVMRKTNLIKAQLMKKYGLNPGLAFVVAFLLFKVKYANL